MRRGGNAKNISPFYVAKELAVSQPVYPHGGQRPQMVYGPPGGQRPQMAYGPPGGQRPQMAYGPPLRPKKPLWQRWWFIALAVFLALVVVGSAAGGGNKRAAARASATPGSGGGAATQENQDPAQQAAPAPTIDSAGSGGGSAGSGDPTSTTTYNGIQKGDVAVNAGESITAKGVTITSSALASGNDVLGPTACTGVTIQNNSGKELDFNIMEFKLLSPSGTIVNAGFAGSHNIIQPGALIDGGSTSGDVCFDTDLAGGGQFVVLYEPLFSSSQKREAWVNNL